MIKKLKEKVLKRNRSSANQGRRARYVSEGNNSSASARGVIRSRSDGHIHRLNLVSMSTRTATENYYFVQSFREYAKTVKGTSFSGNRTPDSVIANPITCDMERLRTLSTVSRSVPNFLDIPDEIETVPPQGRTPTLHTPTEELKNFVEYAQNSWRSERNNTILHSNTSESLGEKNGEGSAINRSSSSTSDKIKRISLGRKNTPEPPIVVPEGIPRKKYIGKYNPKDHESELFDIGNDYKVFGKKSKEKKDISFKRMLSSNSKKLRKPDESTTDSSPIILTEEKRLLRRAEGVRKSVGWKERNTRIFDRKYTLEEVEEIRERKHHYDSINLDKNWCVSQLHAALLNDTHLYQVNLEKDHAFGLGLYLYGLGPDTLVPYVSIYVKDVIQGGYVDRHGTIKPHDQIIKCGGTSFVGIKQEEALKMMKNSTQLQLIMGRKTNEDNRPVTKADHKENLLACGELWFDPKKNPRVLESGDFRLINAIHETEEFFFSKSGSGKVMEVDTSQLSRRDGYTGGSSVSSESGETDDRTPSFKSPTVWLGRQGVLEDKCTNFQQENEQLKAALLKMEKENRQLRLRNNFATQEAKYVNVRMNELAHENVDLRLEADGHVPSSWDDKPELAAEAIQADMNSLMNDDATSISTIRTAEPMLCPNIGFAQMEEASSAALEGISDLEDSFEGKYVTIHTPSSQGSTARLSHSNYSSRRSSSLLTSTLSNVHSTSSLCCTSDESCACDENTPINRVIDKLALLARDGHGDLSENHLFADHESSEDDASFVV